MWLWKIKLPNIFFFSQRGVITETNLAMWQRQSRYRLTIAEHTYNKKFSWCGTLSENKILREVDTYVNTLHNLLFNKNFPFPFDQWNINKILLLHNIEKKNKTNKINKKQLLSVLIWILFKEWDLIIQMTSLVFFKRQLMINE